ncbi:MAG: hypothetical protein WC786_04320, partial [Patescibacteria group bacterium]
MQLPFSGIRAVFLSLICAGVLSILGVFGLRVGDTHAGLTVPTTITQQGTQYGAQEGMGWFPQGAWRGENQSTQRIVHVRPNGADYLVAGVVRYDNAQPYSTTNGVLEFRVSYDAGLTWGQAIRGSTLTLDLVDDSNYFSYSLFVDPNGYDIWVGYVTAKTGATSTYPKTTIRKLIWDGAGGWRFGTYGHAPLLNSGPPSNTIVDASPTAVGVQSVNGKERVWAVIGLRGTGLPWAPPLPYGFYYWLIYTENDPGVFDSSVTVSWTPVGQVFGSPSGYIGDPAGSLTVTGPMSRFAFVPVGQGTTKSIAVIMGKHKTTGNQGGICGSTTTAPEGIQTYILKDSTNPAAWSTGISLATVYPYQEIAFDCNGNGNANNTYSFDYSVGYLPSTTATTSRILLTYEGGTSSATPTVYEDGKLRVKSCTLTAGATPSAVCGSEVAIDSTNQYYAPQAGFHQDKGYIAVRRGGTNRLVIFKEDPVNTWTQILAASPNPTTYAQSPATPAYGPNTSTPTFSINSGLPPVAWAEAPAQHKVNFSANSGGNLFGWGWSSNFGWLSLNCANEGLPPTVCTNPYGTLVAVPPLDSTPSERTSGVSGVTFNPYGYPLSGFAWSSNAGWFTFDRSYSVSAANPNGNPPGQDYNLLSVSTHPIAKYVPSTQKIHGWGRFLNLCSFSSGVCQSKDGGWVRMHGYWLDPARQTTISAVGGYVAGAATISVASCANFATNPGLGMVGAEIFGFSGCAANTLTIISQDRPQKSYLQNTVVSNVTNQGYGVDGYWTGSRYEVSGWAWSTEYGWIHFRPTLFAGFAWLETLFGNIYAQDDIVLPNPQDADRQPLKSCGAAGTEQCYTATYRIEAGGTITQLTVPGTGQTGGFASSAIPYIQTLTNPVTGLPYKLLHSTTAGVLDPFVSRENSASGITFPTVNPDSTTFRNALGKVDVGALTTFVGTPDDDGNHVPSHVKQNKDNRLGNQLYKTDQALVGTHEWKLADLAGYIPAGGTMLGWSPPGIPLNTLRNQVIHVQGDLSMLPNRTDPTKIAETTYSNLAAGTMTVGSAVNFPEQGYLVIDPGGAHQEYYSYTDAPTGT